MVDLEKLGNDRLREAEVVSTAHLLRVQSRLDALEKAFLVTIDEDMRQQAAAAFTKKENGVLQARLERLERDNPDMGASVRQLIESWEPACGAGVKVPRNNAN